jgi:HD-like signal output (HDOD) protein/CheY-like chemotaxis protein
VKRKVLFVDDDPNVLQGLRRMLRPMHQEWDMTFAPSGGEALAILSREPMDIIVSDMRMPGMDGADLLNEVKTKYPQVVRIVLSGHSEQEAILRSVGPAHQYLTKPCEPEVLKSTISRACNIRDVLGNYKLRELVSQLGTLPSLPDLYMELLKELQMENVSLAKVGAIIARDIGMTAKILQLVNSAFFGLPRHVATPAEAVSLLGVDTVKSLVLSLQVFTKFDQAKLKFFSIERLLGHSIATGKLIGNIASAERVDKVMKDQAVLAGFLHDSGQLVLAANLPKKYALIAESMKDNDLTLHEAEYECFGATHAEVGATLLGLWGLPNPIVEAVAFHHTPLKAAEQKLSPLALVHIADGLVNQFHEDASEGAFAGSFDQDYLAQLGVAGKLPAWEEKCRAMSKK